MRALLFSLAIVLSFEAQAQNKKPKEEPEEVSPVKVLSEEGAKKFKEGKYPEAIVFFQQAYTIENNPGFLWNIAICNLKLGKIDTARSYLDLVLIGTAPDSERYQQAKELLDKLDTAELEAKSQETLQPIERLRKGDPAEIKKLADEGNQMFQEQKYQDALSLYQKAYSLDSRPSFLFSIGRCHSMLEEWTAAKDTYHLVLVLLKESDPMYQKAAEYHKEAEEKLMSAPKRVLAEEPKPPTESFKPIKRPPPVRVLYGVSAASFVLGAASLTTGATYLATSPRLAILSETSVGKIAATKSIARNNTLGAIYLGASGVLIAAGVGSRIAANLLDKKLSIKNATLSANANQVLLTVRY
jgi:tetratricopeptide (TPR) repeat protein